jgi:hypothetical protein
MEIEDHHNASVGSSNKKRGRDSAVVNAPPAAVDLGDQPETHKTPNNKTHNNKHANNNAHNNQPGEKLTLLKDGMTLLDRDLARKYARGSLNFNAKKVQHKHLKKTLEETRDQIIHSAARTAATEILLQSDGGSIQMDDPSDKVYKLKQQQIKENVDMNTAKNSFDLQLQNFGPYFVNFSRNGRY